MPSPRANATFVCFMGAFALAGFTGVGFGAYLSWRTLTFRLNAQPATGTVLAKSRGIERTGSGSEMRYTVDYEFHAPGGEFVKNSGYISGSMWDRIKEGDPLRVYYRPANPYSNGLGRPWINWAGIIYFVIGAIFSGVGSIGGYVLVQDMVAKGRSEAPKQPSRQLGGKRGKQRPATARGSSQSKPI